MKNPSAARFAFPRRRSEARQRRGTALVLMAVCMIPIVACLALAIDVGMMTLAQTQLNDAADAAALAGARALNGNTATNSNYAGVTPAAQQVIANNGMLGQTIQNAQLSLNIGRYVYNSSAQQFQGQFPGPSTQNWNMVQATVTSTGSNIKAFGGIFNLTPSLQAVSTAAHQPRDIALILDYSGSMRFGSLLGLLYYGNRNGNNLNPVYPVFGAYSCSTAGIQGTMPASPYLDANIDWTTSDGRPPIAQDFYTSATGGTAFSPASATYATTPAGDVPLKTSKNTGGAYAQTLWGANGVLSTSTPTTSTRDATFESQGYKAYGMASSFNGYTVGPGYWGKTFYIWPPDPTNDWRSKYFTFSGGTPDNSAMWDSNGNWQSPGGSAPYYNVNYNAILNFILNVGPCPFPSRLQSGRIVYYTAIPTTISTSTWPPTDLNQRFWKDYIDYVLGLMQTDSNGDYTVINNGQNGLTGYGADFTWGTVKITALSSLSGSPKPYMFYGDNPLRPQLSFWFGPMTMIDFLGNYNLWYSVNPYCSRYCYWPGTCHEAPMYAQKVGINSALNDIQTNHPNDMLSMIFFSVPQSSATDTSGTRFNRVRVALGQNYTNLVESLWYPPATLGNSSATVTPYDSNNLEVPRAMGGTCYAMGLMLAYNQFSSNASLQTYNPGQPAGDAGGNGRQGAQKIIIFETDGAPNTTASANFVNNGAYQSYYQVRYNSTNPSASDFPNSINGYSDNNATVTSQIYSICTQICASTSSGGFSTPSHPVLINCIAFGPQGVNGLPTLNQMQTIGSVTDGMPSYKVISGNASTIIANLQTAIDKILETGVQVSLIQ
jgi:Flp pilus assembly protein TadG